MGTVNKQERTIDWVRIPTRASCELVDYFLAHESDIAWEMNDFGELHDFFVYLMGREPSKDA